MNPISVYFSFSCKLNDGPVGLDHGRGLDEMHALVITERSDWNQLNHQGVFVDKVVNGVHSHSVSNRLKVYSSLA